jgi:DNA processing protein
MERQRTLLLGLLRLLNGKQWTLVAREARRSGTVKHLIEGSCGEVSAVARDTLATIQAQRHHLDSGCEDALAIVDAAAADGLRLTTILDSDYPENLRTIDQVPPFLFYRGTLLPRDRSALAVVGTRKASAPGIKRAASLASMLGRSGVTVVSGLARGIDTAAHTACLDAGGRTIGVLGAGHWHFYPPENEALATRMEASGAVVSQFWPDTPPSRRTFPIRNAVSSGLSVGTVVVEASHTSGAKMQARLALEQRRLVLLPTSLVQQEQWARDFVARGAIEVPSIAQLEGELHQLLAGEQRPSEDARATLPGGAPSLFAVG